LKESAKEKIKKEKTKPAQIAQRRSPLPKRINHTISFRDQPTSGMKRSRKKGKKKRKIGQILVFPRPCQRSGGTPEKPESWEKDQKRDREVVLKSS